MKDFSSKYTALEEQRLLLRKINDLISRSEKNYSVEYSHFLTPEEQALINKVEEFRGYISFYGGYESAERRLCRICSNEYCSDGGVPLTLYSVIAPKAADIGHRAVLGSLMGLRIKREMIGDIIIGEKSPQFFCHNSIAEFIELNLKKVGKYNVSLKESETCEAYESKTQELSVNVSSMRLDSLTSACFGISRSKAAELIEKGLVSLNYLTCTSVSKELKAGDKISARGKGKAELVEISGMSRKGRLFVKIKKYI